MLERLDRLATAMSAAASGVKLTRSDSMRAAIDAGLAVLEARYAAELKGGTKKTPGKA